MAESTNQLIVATTFGLELLLNYQTSLHRASLIFLENGSTTSTLFKLTQFSAVKTQAEESRINQLKTQIPTTLLTDSQGVRLLSTKLTSLIFTLRLRLPKRFKINLMETTQTLNFKPTKKIHLRQNLNTHQCQQVFWTINFEDFIPSTTPDLTTLRMRKIFIDCDDWSINKYHNPI